MKRLLPLLVAAALAAGCGSDSSEGGQPAAEVKGAAPPIADLYSDGPVLLDGQVGAFKERLAKLKGHPVVVNKWASWCAPCRAEFPFFNRQAGKRAAETAFLGVNASDNDGDARKFLSEFPVPFPSVKDPDQAVAREFKAAIAFPSTAFYDSKGQLVYVKQGGYRSERDLVEDIERYANE